MAIVYNNMYNIQHRLKWLYRAIRQHYFISISMLTDSTLIAISNYTYLIGFHSFYFHPSKVN